MRRGELFDLTDLRIPLSPERKSAALRRIAGAARFGAAVRLHDQGSLRHFSRLRGVMDHLIHSYRLDALAVGAIYHVPWYSLAEYILDPGGDIDEALDEYIRSRYKPA